MSSASPSRRVLVIGVDGATFDLIRPWARDGLLPTFDFLIRNGATGALTSTIPPITGPAWASFQTGTNPGVHGIFDWLSRDDDSYRLVPINAASIRQKVLWQIIGEQGRQVGVINVPVTYPPKEVAGFLVSGMLTPCEESGFTYPRELQQEIKKNNPEYSILPKQRFEKNKIPAWISSLKSAARARLKTALYLMDKYPADFFMVHFTATDTVQHRMWHTIKENPGDNRVLDIYREIDRIIHELMRAAGEDCQVFVISDHGFGPLYRYIYLNNWLLKKKFLKLKKGPITRAKLLLHQLGINPANVYRLMTALGILSMGLRLGKGERYKLLHRFFLSSQNIHWSKTRAYSYGNIGQIYLNRRGREPQGIVSEKEAAGLLGEIIAGLESLQDERGENLIGQLYRKEEIYTGGNLSNAPEILLLPRDLEAMALGVGEFVSDKVIAPAFGFTGGHRMEGICLGYGPGIKHTKLENAHIMDIAPTILYSLNLAIPESMDGKILKDIFRDDFKAENISTYYTDNNKAATSKEYRYTSGEQEAVEQRLKDLGYV